MEKTSIRLSEHFTLAELTKTNTNLKNVPSEAQVANLKRLCGWLEKLRSRYNGGPSPNPSPVREGRKVTIDGSGTPLPNRGGAGGGAPIVINSGYRSPAVNAAVGGARNSQHLTGCAADITAGSPKKNRKLLELILLHFAPAYSSPSREGSGVGLSFDQLIAERCDSNGNPRWLHISYSTRPRRQLLRT